MLTEDELQKIRQEEIFREEVRRQLQAQSDASSGRKRLWQRLNSPFTLWLLSTVVVGLITWGYSKIQQHSADLRNNALAIAELDLQLRSRIDYFVQSLPRKSQWRPGKHYAMAIDLLLEDVPATRTNSIYEERSTLSLLTELAGRVTDAEREEVLLATEATKRLVAIRNQYNSDIVYNSLTSEEETRVVAMITDQARKLTNSRWR